MKRIISLVLTMVLLVACLAVPVMADEVDDSNWVQLLDYGYPIGHSSNRILLSSNSSYSMVTYNNPTGFNITSFDVFFRTDIPTVDVSTTYGSLSLVSLGNGFYRAYGSLNAGTDTSLLFWGSGGTYVDIYSYRISYASFSHYSLSYYGYVYDYSYSPVKETYFSGDGSSPLSAISISPNASNENFNGFVSRIYIPSWNAYDYISLNIALFSSSFASLKVELDGVSVPYQINTVESTDVLGTSLYLLDVLIDTRAIDRTSDSYILVDVSGMVNPTFTGTFSVRSCLGLVSLPSPSL